MVVPPLLVLPLLPITTLFWAWSHAALAAPTQVRAAASPSCHTRSRLPVQAMGKEAFDVVKHSQATFPSPHLEEAESCHARRRLRLLMQRCSTRRGRHPHQRRGRVAQRRRRLPHRQVHRGCCDMCLLHRCPLAAFLSCHAVVQRFPASYRRAQAWRLQSNALLPPAQSYLPPAPSFA